MQKQTTTIKDNGTNRKIVNFRVLPDSAYQAELENNKLYFSRSLTIWTANTSPPIWTWMYKNTTVPQFRILKNPMQVIYYQSLDPTSLTMKQKSSGATHVQNKSQLYLFLKIHCHDEHISAIQLSHVDLKTATN